MMNRLLLLLLPVVFMLSCSDNDKDITFFKGYFPNAKDSIIVLYHNDKPIDTAQLNTSKKALFKLKIDDPKLYYFEIDNNYQYLYLEPKDSVVVFANTMNFNQSVSFSGKGSVINNFMTAQMNKTEQEAAIVKSHNYFYPNQYKDLTDSIYNSKIKIYKTFVSNNPELSKQAKNIALVSSTFPIYKEMEAYPFVYQRNNGNSVINSLPIGFYDYRKNINYNDSFLEYYRPYYSYMVMFINNLAFKKHTIKVGENVDINKNEQFHLKKITVIDSVFQAGNLRDNLFRNAAYAYVLNIQNNRECDCYIEEFDRYNQNNAHKTELDELFKSTLALQTGKFPPDFDLIDLNGNRTSLLKITKKELSIYYFWSVNQPDMSNLIFNRILQLKTLFPNVKFIGIDVGQDIEKWCETAPLTIADSEQYHSTNFSDLSRKLLINNISKSLILNHNSRIVSAFESIFSPNIEKILLKN
ncbi:thioredoxin [Capnocytophaga sp.]|uniref:TlpA family protein disulfide reductase n=1 Tax=Capnocytophaga sp. TaxID=44737 RepID=UPI0026DC4956|nr:thioredoxin [Capnocytophaga sp.]MDO5105700.1 thioredoxin [Capnocytophaga sp.]